MNRLAWLDTLRQDVRDARRSLVRDRRVAGVAVLTLALGIAGVIVMFALIQGVLLRPLPVHEQDRLVVSWREARSTNSARYPFGPAAIDEIARASRLLSATAGIARNGVARMVVTENDTSTYANVALVTGRFFDVLGVQPLLGRVLRPADERDGAESVIVISNGLWQRRYGGGEVLGQRITMDERAFTIVGVMPRDLDYPAGVEIWRTTSSVPTTGPFGDAAREEVNMIARLRPGVSLAQATEEIVALNRRLDETLSPDWLRGLVPVVRPFADVVVGDIRVTLLALFGAVGLVLLMACANVANLLLARGEARRGEIALRAALGAGRARILRHTLAEGFLLSLLAGCVGLAAAAAFIGPLVTLVPDGLPRVDAIHIDGFVALFSVALVAATTLLASTGPAIVLVRQDLASPLRTSATALTGGPSAHGRRLLVVVQFALAVTVLAAGSLLVRSVLRLQAVDLGLPAEQLVLLDLHLPQDRAADRDWHARFLDATIEQLESSAVIAAATPVNVVPFSEQGWDLPRFTAEGQDANGARANPTLNLESIHPNYFETLEVPILSGRSFTAADRADTPAVAIVSADVAADLWPDGDAIGKRLKMGPTDSEDPWYTVVGVADQTRYRAVTGMRPTLYLPAAQFQMTATMIAVRTSASLELLTSLSTTRIATIAPEARVLRVVPFADFLARPLARPRFSAFVLGTFALASLVVSAIGLHAVMAVYVRYREKEIAVRMAVGATAAAVGRMVAGEAARMAGTGVAIGIAGALIATRLLRGMLFEIEPVDPVSLAGAGLLLACVALLATCLPTWRAAYTDVTRVLRGN